MQIQKQNQNAIAKPKTLQIKYQYTSSTTTLQKTQTLDFSLNNFRSNTNLIIFCFNLVMHHLAPISCARIFSS